MSRFSMLPSEVYFEMWRNAQEAEALQREVEEFAATHPDYRRLRKTMVKLLESGLAETLEQAYKQARKLKPKVKRS